MPPSGATLTPTTYPLMRLRYGDQFSIGGQHEVPGKAKVIGEPLVRKNYILCYVQIDRKHIFDYVDRLPPEEDDDD